MSNSEDDRLQNPADDRLIQYDRNYIPALRKLKAENAEKEKIIADWEADPSEKKPPLEYVIGSPLMSQAEMEARADEIARAQLQENDMLERQGLIEPTRESQAMSFEEKLQAKMGEEKILAARKESQHEQDLAKKQDLDQGHEQKR